MFINNMPCLFEIKVVLIIYKMSYMRIPMENIFRNGREHTEQEQLEIERVKMGKASRSNAQINN